jgi:uncharacterized protein YjiS (DUF1127 family)
MAMQAYSKDPLRSAALAAASLQPAALSAFGRAATWLRLSWLGRVAAALVADRQTRIAIDELRSWDDHRLRDIGLERMDIEGAVRGQFRPLPRSAETGGTPPRSAG